MFKLHHLTSAVVVLSLAAGIATPSAAETRTKTMRNGLVYPPSYGPRVYPPPTYYRPLYDFAPERPYCYMPDSACDNQHRMEN